MERDASNPLSITVNTNGYEPEVFEQAERDWDPRAEFGWGEKFVGVYAGGLTQAYDIPTLLRAAERLVARADIHIAIIGEGDRKAEYKTYVRDRGLQNVQFIDYQPRSKMPAILSAADVGVHLFPDDPLWSYVLGNKTFDYLGSGLPMVYAGTGDTAELIEEAEAGYVVAPEDDRALAEVLQQMADAPGEGRAKGQRGRRYVMMHYNRHALLARLEATLVEVARMTAEP